MSWFVIVATLLWVPNIQAAVSIGANLDGLADYSRGLPYVNLIRQWMWGLFIRRKDQCNT